MLAIESAVSSATIYYPEPISLFTCQIPSITDFTENISFELGMKFRSSQNGLITGIRFWKAPSETGQHTGRIWDEFGNQLSSIEFTNETSSQWQQQILNQSLPIEKNKIYIVSVNANEYYVATHNDFSTEINHCPLTGIADGNNGLYGEPEKFPTQSFSSSNYFRDIEFVSTETDTCPYSPSLPNALIHRGYLGWINDLATSPRPNDNWPSIWINDELIQDYENTFKLMEKTGLNEISIWGLFAAHAWPVDIEHAIDANRSTQILKIINEAHQHGIKVLCGLGVYCWGFDDIIRANPSLACSQNASLMCPNNPDAWNWQKRIIDYIFTFPIDGISMQSADQGRCKDCKGLDTLSDVAYHAIINDTVASYVKKNYPGKIVGVNTFGMYLGNTSDLNAIRRLTAHADYLIDVNNTVLNGGSSHLCNVIHAIAPCSYGNLGSPGIEPPMHWERNRWFLPMIKKRSETLNQYYSAGARAVENYMHLIKNPGDEVSLILVATLEKNPAANWQTELKNILNEIYQPKDTFTLQTLADLFLKAESLYYEFAQNPADIISLEPLVSNTSGPPIYLRDKMTSDGMKEYKKNLCILRQVFNAQSAKVSNITRLQYLVSCIDNMIDDLNSLLGLPLGCTLTVTKQSLKKEAEQRLRIAITYLQKKGEIRLMIFNPQGYHTCDLKLWSFDGKLVQSSVIKLVKDNNEINLLEGGLTEGFYFVELIDSHLHQQEHLKLFVQD